MGSSQGEGGQLKDDLAYVQQSPCLGILQQSLLQCSPSFWHVQFCGLGHQPINRLMSL